MLLATYATVKRMVLSTIMRKKERIFRVLQGGIKQPAAGRKYAEEISEPDDSQQNAEETVYPNGETAGSTGSAAEEGNHRRLNADFCTIENKKCEKETRPRSPFGKEG